MKLKRLLSVYRSIGRKILSGAHSKTLTFSPFLLTKASLSPCIEAQTEASTSSQPFTKDMPPWNTEHAVPEPKPPSPSLQEGRGDQDLPAKQANRQKFKFHPESAAEPRARGSPEGESSPWVQVSREAQEVHLVRWVRWVPEKRARHAGRTMSHEPSW